MKTLKKLYLDPIAKLLKNPAHLLDPETFDFAKKHTEPGEAPGIENRKDIEEPPSPGEIPAFVIPNPSSSKKAINAVIAFFYELGFGITNAGNGNFSRIWRLADSTI